MPLPDLLIACSSGYDQSTLRFWVNSARASGFAGRIAVIVLNGSRETTRWLTAQGVEVAAADLDPATGNPRLVSAVPVHVERFFYIWRFLDSVKGKYGRVITTDIRDVVFQTNPSTWLDTGLAQHDLCVSGEGIRFRDESWNDGNLGGAFPGVLHTMLRDREVYNVGAIAGTAEAVTAACLVNYLCSVSRPIPIADQAAFNVLLHNDLLPGRIRRLRADEDFACHAGVNADPAKLDRFLPSLMTPLPRFEDGRVLTATGVPYCIVHQYDRVPAWRAHFEQIFG